MTQKSARPLSPHLQVYKPQLTSITSILHRATGVFLSACLVGLSWWLVAAAIGPGAYAIFTGAAGSLVGQLIFIGGTVSLYYHLANGIRHLIWDSGKLFKLRDAYAAGYFVLFFTVIMTAITWACILTKAGV